MGHCIKALIGSPTALAGFDDSFGDPLPKTLSDNLLILGLNDDRLDLLADFSGAAYDGFVYLCDSLRDAVIGRLGGEPALYIETNYFGGTGSQAAALFRAGKLVWLDATEVAPIGSDSGFSILRPQTWRKAQKLPINRGLEILGVERIRDLDEFDTVGLGRFRTVETFGLDD